MHLQQMIEGSSYLKGIQKNTNHKENNNKVKALLIELIPRVVYKMVSFQHEN